MTIIESETQDTLNKHFLKNYSLFAAMRYMIFTWVQNNNPQPVPLRYSTNISQNLYIVIDIKLLDPKSCFFCRVIMIINA